LISFFTRGWLGTTAFAVFGIASVLMKLPSYASASGRPYSSLTFSPALRIPWAMVLTASLGDEQCLGDD
jgi:hypothetical protein